jgi:methylthioribulose-1-phosphate dehydratase
VKRTPPAVARALADVGRRCYARGWVFGTSGNFSAVVSTQPLRVAITASGRDKRQIRPADVLTVDAAGVGGAGRGRLSSRPSAETLLHLAIARSRKAGAVMHTHSIWGTLLSEAHARDGGIAVEGYEMLKGLSGVGSHRHREWIPILENDQDMQALAGRVEEALASHPPAHAILLRRHGLYTWGDSLADAERHLEILEFLFEAIGRRDATAPGWRQEG